MVKAGIFSQRNMKENFTETENVRKEERHQAAEWVEEKASSVCRKHNSSLMQRCICVPTPETPQREADLYWCFKLNFLWYSYPANLTLTEKETLTNEHSQSDCVSPKTSVQMWKGHLNPTKIKVWNTMMSSPLLKWSSCHPLISKWQYFQRGVETIFEKIVAECTIHWEQLLLIIEFSIKNYKIPHEQFSYEILFKDSQNMEQDRKTEI